MGGFNVKVWISIDMEGISGIVDRDQLLPNGSRYPRARESMMGDLMAVLSALQDEPDVKTVLINDSHDGMLNILPEALPAGVHLISGGAKQWSMNQGAKGADVAFYVGYHARAGTPAAIMDHTYSGEIVRVVINGVEVGETGINAALAGSWGVPIALVTGDDKVAQEASALLPEIETAIVKYGISRRSAELLSRSEVDSRLKEAVRKALGRFRKGALKPWVVKTPVDIQVTVATPGMADRAMYVPGAVRVDGRTVSFIQPNMEEAFRAFYSVMALVGEPLY